VGVPVELRYKGEYLEKAYVLDILVENEIILEIKSVSAMEPIFKSQLITYLKLAKKQLGYLINFNVPLMKEGFQRVVHQF
jgi:GxxExxY protein